MVTSIFAQIEHTQPNRPMQTAPLNAPTHQIERTATHNSAIILFPVKNSLTKPHSSVTPPYWTIFDKQCEGLRVAKKKIYIGAIDWTTILRFERKYNLCLSDASVHPSNSIHPIDEQARPWLLCQANPANAVSQCRCHRASVFIEIVCRAFFSPLSRITGGIVAVDLYICSWANFCALLHGTIVIQQISVSWVEINVWQ